MRPFAISCTLIVGLLHCPASPAQQIFALNPAHKIVILGDSNTYAGHYIVYLEAALRQKFPKKKLNLLNLGLPSETTSGLNEPDHPFPRPTVHTRLDRVLAKTKPDVVLACYGMNDGIYYPFSKTRFAAYKKGIDKLIAKVKKSGAKLVLLTPPPFDPLPLRKRKILRPAGAERYAWKTPYEDYDCDVLRRYAQWIMKQAKRVDMVIDIRTPIVKHLQLKRKTTPDYVLAGDGIHPNKQGHRLIANAILNAWRIEPPAKYDDEKLKLIADRQFLLRDSWLTHTGHKRPGIRKGLPLAQARTRAAELDRRIRGSVKK